MTATINVPSELAAGLRGFYWTLDMGEHTFADRQDRELTRRQLQAAFTKIIERGEVYVIFDDEDRERAALMRETEDADAIAAREAEEQDPERWDGLE